MVDRRDQGQAHPGDVEHPVAEHLVVVDDVEVVPAYLEQPRDPFAERLRLGEPGRAHGQELLDVDEVAELPGLGHPERIRLAVEVEARDLGQPHALIELRVGLSGEDLDGVPECHEFTAEMTDVDALAAAVWLASVGQECDAQVAPFLGPVRYVLDRTGVGPPCA